MTKKLPLPKTVKIGPRDFAIERTLSPFDKLYGSFQVDEGIRLAKDAKHPMLVKEVLLHEILHGCIQSYVQMDSDEEEKAVYVLAPSLLQMLRENPEIVDFLLEEV